MRYTHTLLFGLAWVALLVTACGGQGEPHQFELNGRTMGTTWSIKLVKRGRQPPPAELTERIEARLERINAQMSTYRRDSALSRFNRCRGTGWRKVPSALVSVVTEAQRTSRLSDGAFDITVGPLVNLWGFGKDGPRKSAPSAEQISKALARTGYRYLHARRTPPALRKDIPGLQLDLSAIAKGYAVDQLAELLLDAGYRNFLVEIGGELRTSGVNAEGRPWRIAIERPSLLERSPQLVLSTHATAMATSGDYRNFFTDQGHHYAHTIDPRTGTPVPRSLASVTVLDASCMRADALATAIMALGPEKGMALADKFAIPAYLIEHTGAGFKPSASRVFRERFGDQMDWVARTELGQIRGPALVTLRASN